MTRDFVGNSSIRLPARWSYSLAKQGTDSWNFSISPFPFNPGDRCAGNKGPLVGSLFERAEVFITGFAYVSHFPPAAETFEQTLGNFALDERTLANYEGFCRPTYRMDFSLNDYYLSVHVAVHDKAQESSVDRALDVLNSIREG